LPIFRIGDGVELAVSFLKEHPDTRAIVMGGTALDEEEMLLCQRYDIPFRNAAHCTPSTALVRL
jgi:hypothetical protein